MKITIVGAGSTYTPGLILRWIETKKDRIPLTELFLYDIDAKRLQIVGDFIKAMLAKEAPEVRVVASTDRKESIIGASFVIMQMRVGGNEQRLIDEHLCVKHGFAGQETTGPAGFALALRQVPAGVEIAQDVAKYAPEAWIISVANPAGLLGEALIKYGHAKSIGMCHGGIYVRDNFSRILGVQPDQIDFDYLGLNHLSWISKVFVDGKQLPPEQVTELAAKTYEEWNKHEVNITSEFARDFAPPMTVHHYMAHFFVHDETVQDMREKNASRADAVLEIERQCLEYYEKEVGKTITPPPALAKRGGVIEETGRPNHGAIGYSDGCMAVIDALLHPEPQRIVVNVLNHGSIRGIVDDACVEVSAYVNHRGVHRLILGELPIEVRGQVQAVKAYETMTVEAAVKRDKRLALKALLSNPICHCRYYDAKKLFEELLEANKKYIDLK